MKINFDDASNILKLNDRLVHVQLPPGAVIGGAFLFMAEIIRLVRAEAPRVILVVCLLVAGVLLPIFWRYKWRIPLVVGTVADWCRWCRSSSRWLSARRAHQHAQLRGDADHDRGWCGLRGQFVRRDGRGTRRHHAKRACAWGRRLRCARSPPWSAISLWSSRRLARCALSVGRRCSASSWRSRPCVLVVLFAAGSPALCQLSLRHLSGANDLLIAAIALSRW